MRHIFTHSKKGILMVTLFATLLSFAKESTIFFNLEIVVNKTALTLNNVKEGNLLTLKDKYGAILYEETIKESGKYSKQFELSFLPNGIYTFEVDKDLEINLIPFKITNGIAFFEKSKETTVYKPIARVEGDLVYVSKLSIDHESLDIEIYHTDFNREEKLIHTESISDSKKIERVYKLEGLNKGNYRIVLSSAGKTVEKYF
ncbi:hypothetical protein [Tamlana sp. I1]|uniref:hypothetical protein n=1 Tax=Tamlana sp. I1 TaxID=2762061 RepID=UPI00188EF182|nr:hypothetical protein [Tamlana sp. I1]